MEIHRTKWAHTIPGSDHCIRKSQHIGINQIHGVQIVVALYPGHDKLTGAIYLHHEFSKNILHLSMCTLCNLVHKRSVQVDQIRFIDLISLNAASLSLCMLKRIFTGPP